MMKGKKTLVRILLLSILLSLSNVFADESVTSSVDNTSGKVTTDHEDSHNRTEDSFEYAGAHRNEDSFDNNHSTENSFERSSSGTIEGNKVYELNEHKKEKIEKIKQMRDDAKASIKVNKTTMKSNIQNFRQENKDSLKATLSTLDDTSKESLKSLNEEYKTKAQEIHDKIKDTSLSLDDRKILLQDLENLRAEQHSKMQELFAGNEEALKLLDMRKNVFQANKALREENMTIRQNFRETQKGMIAEYQETLIKKLSSVIEKASISQLEKISIKITQLISKYNANTKISEEQKTKILSQLEALQNIVNDKLNSSETVDELNIESLLETN